MNHNISIGDQLSMVLRRIPLRMIKDCVMQCHEAGVTVSHNYFDAHHTCGGDVNDLVDGIVYRERKKLKVSLDQLAARQLYEQFEGGRTLKTNLTEFFEAGIWDLSDQPSQHKAR